MQTLKKLPKITLRAAIAGALSVSVPAAMLALPAAPAAAQSDQLDQVVSALRGISTMTADFTQTDRKGQSLSGKLSLKRPGKIRFEYQKSANMLVVSNGKSLYLIDYEVNQVQRWPISNSPLGALLARSGRNASARQSTIDLLRKTKSARIKSLVNPLVNECRWQLDWLLRMQVPAGDPLSGMAFHRVHGTQWSPMPGWPHEDPTERVLHRPSTGATRSAP